jgi:hypothetical protein
VNIIDPRDTPPLEWIDTVADLYSGVIPLMILREDGEWREWGYHARQTLSLRGILTPDPDEYSEFEDWAMRFNQVISSVPET